MRLIWRTRRPIARERSRPIASASAIRPASRRPSRANLFALCSASIVSPD